MCVSNTPIIRRIGACQVGQTSEDLFFVMHGLGGGSPAHRGVRSLSACLHPWGRLGEGDSEASWSVTVGPGEGRRMLSVDSCTGV